MKEYIEYLKDSFTDYTGKEHYFIIAAISQELPTKTEEIGRDDLKDYDVIHEVSMYIEDYGTEDYLGVVTKVLRLGVAMCNPVDQYNEKTGIMKATARARKSDPALYSRDKGTINTKVVNLENILNNFYTKTEVDNKIQDAISSTSGNSLFTTINDSEFTIDDNKILNIKNIAISKITNLETILNSKAL